VALRQLAKDWRLLVRHGAPVTAVTLGMLTGVTVGMFKHVLGRGKPMLITRKPGQTFVVTEADLGIEDPAVGVTYTLRVPRRGEIAKLAHRHWPDAIECGHAMVDLVLVDWSGIESCGVPVPCTSELKRHLSRNTRLVEAIAAAAGVNDRRTYGA
jgi:hypothetical protein